MATAEELLATVGNEENIIVIDSDLRTMTFPASVKNIGVENDKDVHKLNFMMPRYFGEYDLSTFNIRINYLNAQGDGDMYVVTDPTVEDDAIYFSWLVGRHACLYRGAVTFIVCLKLADGEGDVAQEFNTTLASLQVLPGLETEPTILETDYDIIEQLLLTVQDTNDKIKAVLDSGMTAEELGNIAKEQKTLKSRMDEFASLPDGSTAGDAELTDIRVGADGTQYATAGEAVRAQINDVKNAVTVVKSASGSVLGIDDAVAGSAIKAFSANDATNVYRGSRNLFDWETFYQNAATKQRCSLVTNSDGSVTVTSTATGGMWIGNAASVGTTIPSNAFKIPVFNGQTIFMSKTSNISSVVLFFVDSSNTVLSSFSLTNNIPFKTVDDPNVVGIVPRVQFADATAIGQTYTCRLGLSLIGTVNYNDNFVGMDAYTVTGGTLSTPMTMLTGANVVWVNSGTVSFNYEADTTTADILASIDDVSDFVGYLPLPFEYGNINRGDNGFFPDASEQYYLTYCRTNPYNPIHLEMGDIVCVKSPYFVIISADNFSSGWRSTNTEINNSDEYVIVVRRSDGAQIDVDDVIKNVYVKRKTSYDAELADIRVGADGTTYESAGDAVRTQINDLKADHVDVIKNTLGCISPLMELGNYNYADGRSEPDNSSYMADRRARSVGSIHLNVGDIVTISNSQTLTYALNRYDDTSSVWVHGGWTSNDTVITIEADYYVVIYKLGNLPVSSINELISDFCIVKAEYAGYVFNQLQKINAGEEESLPDYYFENDYWPDKLAEIKNSMNFSNGVCFAFITDVHFPSNRERSGLMLKEILQKTNVPFVIYGGDTPALFGNENQLDAAIATLIEYMSLVGKNNWYAVRGNHDLYCRTNETPTTVYSKNKAETYNAMVRPTERFVTNMNPSHMCYCIDIPAQKTRFVMLNSSDMDAATGGGNYTTEQLEWLVSVLKEVSNTKIVVISHIPSDSVLTSTEASVTASVQNILSAMQNKGAVTVGSSEYSFADSTNQIICHINGHKHQDLHNFENNILSIVTTCDAAYTDDGEGYAVNTITEQAFDVYMLDYDNGIVKTIRCGRGSNRAWTYADGNEVTS